MERKPKTSRWLTPYYSFRASGNMLYESFKVSPRGPAAGNTCASMGKLINFVPKRLQMMRFWTHFLNIFIHDFSSFFIILEASNAFKMMFFDVLEVQGPSQIDSGSNGETSFFCISFTFLNPYVR